MKISEALGNIDDAYLSEALGPAPKPKSRRSFKFATLAACLVLAIGSAIFPRLVNSPEKFTPISYEEACEYKPCAEIIPLLLSDGYTLDGEIGISNKNVISAEFSADDGSANLSVTFADSGYFGDVIRNIIIIEGGSCRYYADFGDSVVMYSLDTVDFAELEKIYRTFATARPEKGAL